MVLLGSGGIGFRENRPSIGFFFPEQVFDGVKFFPVGKFGTCALVFGSGLGPGKQVGRLGIEEGGADGTGFIDQPVNAHIRKYLDALLDIRLYRNIEGGSESDLHPFLDQWRAYTNIEVSLVDLESFGVLVDQVPVV
jgi:hypothetical protein